MLVVESRESYFVSKAKHLFFIKVWCFTLTLSKAAFKLKAAMLQKKSNIEKVLSQVTFTYNHA